MDKRVEKKKWSRTKTMYMAGIIVFLILAIFGFKAINKKNLQGRCFKNYCKEGYRG